MTATALAADRPVYLTREGSVFRLSFTFDPALLARVKELPHASFDPATRTWTTTVCTQSVNAMRAWFYEGLTGVSVDSLIGDGESVRPVARATLRAGTVRRPFVVSIATRGDGTYELLQSIPGGAWDKKAAAVTFGPHAAAKLAELVDRGILQDDEKLLTPAAATVQFDPSTGRFKVRGEDRRADAAFQKSFPEVDVVARWKERGLDVAFSDAFTQEIYEGEIARRAPLSQPAALKVELFDFQKENVAVALKRSGFAIFDVPGLGKTVQAIAVGAQLLADGAVPRVAVMVPAAVRSQWRAEIIRFTGCAPADVVVVEGGPEHRARAYEAGLHAKWVVVHYDILAKDLRALRPLFAGALVVADEAHRLKTYNSGRTKAALELCRSAARRLALSGTPVEAHVSEWYQLLSGFAVPGCFGSVVDFNSQYRYKTKFGYEGARNLPELRERSRFFYGRHTKEEVAAHLPPLRVEQLILDTDPAYAAALRRAHRSAADEIEAMRAARTGHRQESILKSAGPDGEDEPNGAEMTAVGQLRMLCSSPRLLHASDSDAAEALTGAGLVPDIDGPKLDELRVMAADFAALSAARRDTMVERGLTVATPAMVQQERFVVFTFSRRMAELIAARFKEDGVAHVLYTGTTSRQDRDRAVDAFTDPNSDVLAFIATDAAAEGLNLGKCCSTLVQFDLPWTPSRAQQRMNRIHRLDGTAERYLVINMVLANTLEIGISRMLGERADLQDAVFGEEGSRYKTTGRRGRSTTVFEQAMEDFAGGKRHKARGRATTASLAPADPVEPQPLGDPFPEEPAPDDADEPATLFG